MAVRVALLLFDAFDLLDTGGPYEVLLTANRLASRDGDPAPFDVVTVARRPGPVAAYGGLRCLAQHSPEDLGEVDVLLVPGTVDVDAALGDHDLVATVAGLADAAGVAVVSVCTGAFLLAAAGLLDDRTATTHHEDLAALADRDDVGRVVGGVRWVDDGNVVTVAGLSSGIAGGLHLVDRFAGRGLALRTAAQIEHAWHPEGEDVPVDGVADAPA